MLWEQLVVTLRVLLELERNQRKTGSAGDKSHFGVAFSNCPHTVPVPLGIPGRCCCVPSFSWKKQRLQNVGQFSSALPVPDYPDDANEGVPSASKARRGSQVTFLMFDGSLQFLFTHFKITEGDHLLPSC